MRYFAFLFAFLFLLFPIFAQDTFYVDPTAEPPGLGTSEAPFPTFKQALDALPNGGTIMMNGTLEAYESKVRIHSRYYPEESPLIVSGHGWDQTISLQQVSINDSRNVVVKDMTVFGGIDLRNNVPDEGLALKGVMLEHLDIKYGRLFSGGYTFSDITMKDCRVSEILYSGQETHGIYFSGGHWEKGAGIAHPNHINIVNCEIKFAGGRHGIQFNGCYEDVKIKGNTIYCTAFTAFQGIGIQRCEISDNTFLIGNRGGINCYDYWDGHYWDPSNPDIYDVWIKVHHPNQYWWIHHNTFLVGPHEWCWWQGTNHVKNRPCILFNNELHGGVLEYPDIGKKIEVVYPPMGHVVEDNLMVSPWANMIEFHDPYACWVTTVRNNMMYTYQEGASPIISFASDVPVDPHWYSIDFLQTHFSKLYYGNILDVDPEFALFPEFPHASEIPPMNYQFPPNASYDWSKWPGKFDLHSGQALRRGKGRRENVIWTRHKFIPAKKRMNPIDIDERAKAVEAGIGSTVEPGREPPPISTDPGARREPTPDELNSNVEDDWR